MASAIKCDKCGMTSTKVSDFMHIRVYTMASATRYKDDAVERFEVCQKCYDEIFKFKEALQNDFSYRSQWTGR